MSALKLSAKDFVKNIIFPALHSSVNSEYENGKNEVFIDDEISKINLEYIDELVVKKNYYYSIMSTSSFRKIQNELNANFLSKIPINSCSKAYRTGVSYLNFLEPHSKNFNYLRLDIKNCFHSISHDVLRACFSPYFMEQKISNNSNQLILDGFINLVTMELNDSYKNKVLIGKKIIPIGFPTSPLVVNVILRKIDLQIEKLCLKYNIVYTRYADDLLFSEPKGGNVLGSKFFNSEVEMIVSMLDLKLNDKKTVFKRHTISLNGYVIQSKSGKDYSNVFKENNISDYAGIRLSNKKLNSITTAVKLIVEGELSYKQILRIAFKNNSTSIDAVVESREQFAQVCAKHQLVNKLSGYRSFLISLIIFNDKFNCTPKVIINKYKGIIDSIDSVIEVNLR